tara:strand:- start:2849 stop:3124 length:276 start_codon:yes stop_codon:yes gene_type:complete
MNVTAIQNDLGYSRLGMAVSKRVGNSVTRNLVKRRIHGVFSEIETDSGLDVVIAAKPETAYASYAELDRVVRKSLAGAVVTIESSRQWTVL